MKLKIYYSDIIAFLFFHISFITLPYFEYYNFMKYGIIVIIAIYLFCNCKAIFQAKYRTVNIVLFLFLFIVLITAYINRHDVKDRNVFLASIVFVAIVVEAFFLFQCVEHKNQLNRVIKVIYCLNVIYVVVTDLLMLFYPELVVRTEGYYLIGNKFSVVYAHLLMCCLYWYVKGKNRVLSYQNKTILFLICSLTIFISIYADCATGIVASVFLFMFMMFNKHLCLLTMKPLIPVVTLCLSCSILLLSDSVLRNTFVQFVVEDVLQKDITLTGRMNIYASVLSLLPGHFWSGYGYGSTYEVCMKLLGAPNTQNGLLEILVQYGIIGVSLFLLLVYLVFRKNKNLKSRKHSMPIVAMLYIYIVLASVEITLELDFIVLLAILTVCSEMDKKYNINIVSEKEDKQNECVNSLNAKNY